MGPKATAIRRVGKQSMKALFRPFLSGGVCFWIKEVYSGIIHKHPGSLHQLECGNPSVILNCRGGDWRVPTGEFVDERGIIRCCAFKRDERPQTASKMQAKIHPEITMLFILEGAAPIKGQVSPARCAVRS